MTCLNRYGEEEPKSLKRKRPRNLQLQSIGLNLPKLQLLFMSLLENQLSLVTSLNPLLLVLPTNQTLGGLPITRSLRLTKKRLVQATKPLDLLTIPSLLRIKKPLDLRTIPSLLLIKKPLDLRTIPSLLLTKKPLDLLTIPSLRLIKKPLVHPTKPLGLHITRSLPLIKKYPVHLTKPRELPMCLRKFTVRNQKSSLASM
jgi:hypothetical protein